MPIVPEVTLLGGPGCGASCQLAGCLWMTLDEPDFALETSMINVV